MPCVLAAHSRGLFGIQAPQGIRSPAVYTVVAGFSALRAFRSADRILPMLVLAHSLSLSLSLSLSVFPVFFSCVLLAHICFTLRDAGDSLGCTARLILAVFSFNYR